MSNSRRQSPVSGVTTATSEKADKRRAHQRLRARTRVALIQDSDVLPALREVSDPWDMPKDGKIRFDPVRSAKGMRK